MTSSHAYAGWDPWTYRRDTGMNGHAIDLVGFGVEATDGTIGSITEATYEVGASYVIVDTGPWIFGSRVMLPAGTISRIDRETRIVHVHRSTDEIKNAPNLDKNTQPDRDYRDRLGEYYGKFR